MRKVARRSRQPDRVADVMAASRSRCSRPISIAWPVAYFYLHRWLEGYAYRVPLNPLYFLTTGAVALLIAWATVYAVTLRLARTNPVHALRYE